MSEEELLGVVVHGGLVLARNEGAVAALRRITAFPTGLTLDAVVLARGIHAEAARRRHHEAVVEQAAKAESRREHEATAEHDREALAQRRGPAAVGRERSRAQELIERGDLREFDEGDVLRLGVLAPRDVTRWLDVQDIRRVESAEQLRLEASYWLAPLPEDGLLTVACAWPEIGLDLSLTDLFLADLRQRAAGVRSLWDASQGP